MSGSARIKDHTYNSRANGNKRMWMHVGQRVQLLSTTGKEHRIVFSARVMAIFGYVLDIVNLPYNCRDIYIYLIQPLNRRPTKLEVDKSKKYGLPADGFHLMIIKSATLASEYDIRPTFDKDDGSMEYMDAPGEQGVFCYDCKRICLRRDAIWTCTRGHMICCEHLFPWNRHRHCPDWAQIKDHLNLFVSNGKNLGGKFADEFAYTRALLSFNRCSQARTGAKKGSIIQEFVEYDTLTCSFCYCLHEAGSRTRPLEIYIAEIHGQLNVYATNPLFPEQFISSDEDRDDRVQKKELVPREMYDRLCRRGYKMDEIDEVVGSGGVDLDEDMVEAMMESNRSTYESRRRTGGDLDDGIGGGGGGGGSCGVETGRSFDTDTKVLSPAPAPVTARPSPHPKEQERSWEADEYKAQLWAREEENSATTVIGTVVYRPQLLRGILVTVRHLARGRHRLVYLQAGSDYPAIIAKIAAEMDIPREEQEEMLFYHISSCGWAKELRGRTASASAADCSTVAPSKQPSASSSQSYRPPFYSSSGEFDTGAYYRSHNTSDRTDLYDSHGERKYTSEHSRERAALSTGGESTISQSSIYCDISDLQANDCIQVGGMRQSIGPRFKLDEMAENSRYNALMKEKIVRLQEVFFVVNFAKYEDDLLSFLNRGAKVGMYEGFRKIRGDGNCYYRAVAFGLLEQLILSGKGEKEFERLKVKFATVSFVLEEEQEQRNHAELLEKLDQAARGETWISVRELEEDFNRQGSAFDLAVVRACKALISEYLVKHEDTKVNDISIKEAILTLHEDCGNMHDYCETYVKEMGKCAEGAFVDLGVLLSELQCEGNIAVLDRASPDLYFKETKLTTPSGLSSLIYSAPKPVATIDLILRAGHYDLLYPLASIPELVDSSQDRRIHAAEIARKVLRRDGDFELYTSLVEAGVVAPLEQLIEWSESGYSFDEVISMYITGEHAHDYLEASDPEGRGSNPTDRSTKAKTAATFRLW